MITPLNNKIQIEIEKPTAGSLDLSGKPTAVEYGKVIAIADPTATEIQVGDMIMFKAWALDIIDYNDNKYYFIDADSEGICATI